MKNRLKYWRSTITGTLIGGACFTLIWFEKIPDNWITELGAIGSVVIGILSKDAVLEFLYKIFKK